MQEFLERIKALNDFNWQGSPWQYLLYAGILLVLLFSKRKMARLVLGWLPLVYLICIYNPLFIAGMELMGVGDRQYFVRMFSFMPMMYAIAAGIVFLIGRILKSWLKFFMVVAVCAGLILSGRSIYDQSWFVRAQNFAKVPNDTYQVAAILENTGDKDVSVATFDPITNYMRQVSDVITAYARTPWDIWYLLNADPPDVQAVMKTAGEQGMDFITSRRTDTTIQAFHDAGYEPYAFTDNLAIYEVTGVRKTKRKFNEKRQIVSVIIYDAEGNVVPDNQGYSSTAIEYDDNGYEYRENYLDEDGNLMMIIAGFASYVREYSERGLLKSYWFENLDGQPVLISGRFITRYEYDSKGVRLRESYYDADGFPMNRTDTFYACVKYAYNAQGLLESEKYYDSYGNLTLCSNNYAECRRTYNEAGWLLEESFFDEKGQPTISDDGYHSLSRIYDEDGNITSVQYLDVNGDQE